MLNIGLRRFIFYINVYGSGVLKRIAEEVFFLQIKVDNYRN